MANPPRVLVSGASGFLGRECQRQFSEAGFEVIGTDIVGSVSLRGDLADDMFASRLPDVEVVVHCAAATYIQGAPLLLRRSHFMRNNVIATKNIVRRYDQVGVHFINVGTSMMYRQTGAIPYAPSSPLAASGIYSESKLLAQEYVEAHPNTATVIPCIIGGEGRYGLFRHLVTMISGFNVACGPTTRHHPIQMVHVEDVASLIVTVALRRAVGWFNAGGDDPLTLTDWIVAVSRELHRENTRTLTLPFGFFAAAAAATGYRFLAREQLEMLRTSHVLCTKAARELGWKATYSNADVIRGITQGITA